MKQIMLNSETVNRNNNKSIGDNLIIQMENRLDWYFEDLNNMINSTTNKTISYAA
jgi:uncharacterized protein YneR